ncbi:MAG: DUF3179 domain-containing protein [Acidobacteria bacterium]|nr:DUF3179 domain-containing protein [Acidobacteriota bacterium]
MRTIFFSVIIAFASLGLAEEARKGPPTVAVIDGEPIYKVLEPGAIPAIENPTFVTGETADKQMKPEEPVMGVVIKGEAHAYSLWQLDAHEIVNDEIRGTAFAATW